MAKDLPEGAPVMLRMSVEREDGFLSWLGVEMDEVAYGEARLTVPFDESITNREEPPTVNDGVVATLMKQAGELAMRTTRPDPVNDPVETLSMDVNFLNEAAHDLDATADVVETTDETGVVTVTVESKTTDGTRTTIATGQSVFRFD